MVWIPQKACFQYNRVDFFHSNQIFVHKMHFSEAQVNVCYNKWILIFHKYTHFKKKSWSELSARIRWLWIRLVVLFLFLFLCNCNSSEIYFSSVPQALSFQECLYITYTDTHTHSSFIVACVGFQKRKMCSVACRTISFGSCFKRRKINSLWRVLRGNEFRQRVSNMLLMEI